MENVLSRKIMDAFYELIKLNPKDLMSSTTPARKTL
jgi:hypothetical protein